MWGTRIPIGLLLVLSGLLLPGCGAETSPPGEVPLAPTGARLDAHRWLGEPVRVDNLTVWPVLTDAPLDVGEFLTLEEAEQRGVAAVREVGGAAAVQVEEVLNGEPPQDLVELNDANDANDTVADAPAGEQQELETQGQVRAVGQVLAGGGAVVNTLVIENEGDLPILVCAGTIVKGGQQDRQIGQDFVIAAKTTVPVDAFCVEPGRWQVRDGDGSLGLAFTNEQQGMAVKSVRASAQYEKDQGKVWTEVGKVLEAQEIAGTTTFVAANEAVDAKALALRAATAKRVTDHFERLAHAQSAPVGFAYAVDGRPVTVRAFAHERLLRSHLAAFVKAMVLEAELAALARGDEAAPPAATAADVVAMVESLRTAEAREERTAGDNWNAYRSSEAAFNGECRIRLSGVGPDRVVLTEDWTAK